jgi:hypothetical protein
MARHPVSQEMRRQRGDPKATVAGNEKGTVSSTEPKPANSALCRKGRGRRRVLAKEPRDSGPDLVAVRED